MSNSKTNMNIGGWSAWNFNIDGEEQKVFDTAMEDLLGVDYFALAAATRPTSEDNFAFICKATPVVEEPMDFLALVNITALSGKAQIVNIQRIPPAPHAVPGGYSGWSFPASADAVEALDKAEQLVGSTFNPYGSSQQVVSGVNYAVFCQTSPVVAEKGAGDGATVVTVYAPLDGAKPQISSIMDILPGAKYLETE